MKKLLYIEDSPASQLLMKKHLAPLGRVSIAASLAEAGHLLNETGFDLVLADVSLPDGNSLDLVQQLRRRFSPGQLPVIVLSVSMDRLLMAQAFQAGANDCFLKPTPWDQLLPAVQRMLEQPYVRPNETGAIAATWIEGLSGGKPWIFCPQLGLHLAGDDADVLRGRMTDAIRKASATHPLPLASRVRIVDQLLPPAKSGRDSVEP
ncbi:MAG: response regulator [Verrucomicrobiota bacterium]